MSIWTITVPAQSGVGGSGGNQSTITPPGDFDGATINSITLGTPTGTVVDSENSNDSIWIRFFVETTANVAVYGAPTINDSSLAYHQATFDQLAHDLVLGAATTPAPTTAVAADWNQIAWDWVYTASGKDDVSTLSWVAFDIVVDYTVSVVVPILSAPLEPVIGQTTATIRCSTDTATGTLYWYVSTSATAPTAADLKNGTGTVAGRFGNIVNPGTGTEDFNVTGLDNNTTYYSYFIHTDTLDSTILESGSWVTDPPVTGSETFATTLNDTRTTVQNILASVSYDNSLAKELAKYNISPQTLNLSNTLDYNYSITFQEAISFILQLSQEEAKQKTSSSGIELQSVLDYLFTSLRTGGKSITIGTLLDTILQAPKTKDIAETLPITLSMEQVGGKSITGASTFGVTLGYLTNQYKTTLAQMNVDMVLSTTEEASKIISEAQNFTYTLSFDEDLAGIGILDDPIFSAGNYIFVDLHKVLAASSGIVTGEITFTNNLGVSHSVGLIGNAAVELLTTLAYQDLTRRIVDDSNIFATLLDHSETIDFTKFLTFTAGLNLDELPAYTTNILKSVVEGIALAYDEATVAQTDKVLTFSIQLNAEILKQLTSTINLSFDTTMVETFAVLADVDKAITFLTNYGYDYVTGATEYLTFATNVLQTQQVESILNPTFTILNSLSQQEQKNAILNSTRDFLIDLREQLLGEIGIFKIIAFAASFAQEDLNTLTVDKAFELVINLAESTNIQLDKTETILLLMQLTDLYPASKVTTKSALFNTNLGESSAGLLSKLASMVFASTLDHLESKNISTNKTIQLLVEAAQEQEVQLTTEQILALDIILNDNYTNISSILKAISFDATLNELSTATAGQLAQIIFDATLSDSISVQTNLSTLADFSTILVALLQGDITGIIEGFLDFGLSMRKDEVVLSTLLHNIDFENIMDITSIAGKNLLASIDIQAQLGDSANFSLTKEGIVNFRTDVVDILGTQITYTPSLDFNLQSIDSTSTNKNILGNMLIDLETDLLTTRTRTLPGLINYGLTQEDLQTELRVVAEGTINISTNMYESSVLNSLSQIGITFGHILGLSALSSADISESIAFGTITNFSIEGFVIQFEVTTPDGRVLKVYFEDRITIVDEEKRILKVYKDPSTTIK